jgi:RNA polymerase sigma factor (sigma-70 family)
MSWFRAGIDRQQRMQEKNELPAQSPRAMDASDQELLRAYVATGTDDAFELLVAHYVDLVYSAAFRQTCNHATAQDVTQAVFIVLARKAASLRRETVLAGWLFRAVRYAALDARKIEARRQLREQEAALMQQTDSLDETGSEWEQLAPLLDEGLASLGQKDRHAVLLRFFEKKSFGEIGTVLGGNENSARVRVVRAVEKLRGFFHRRGVKVSAAALSGALLSNAVQAAPPALAASLAGGATTAGQTTLALIQAVLLRLFWRRAVRIGAGVAFLLFLAGVTTTTIQQRQAAQAAELGDAARSVRQLMIDIDRTYASSDPSGFIALLHFGSPSEQRFQPVLADYARAQWLFRREMRRAFNVQQRTFDVTFRELCVGQPPLQSTYIQGDRAATNIMMARYPVHFIKTGGTWKWDVFHGLSNEAREQRVATLRHKTVVLDKVTAQVRDGALTNVVEILETIRNAAP